jgi:TolA-binding protein
MKKISRAILLVLPLVSLLSHCAPYDEVQRLQSQLRTANRRLEDMKSNQADAAQREQAASSSEQLSQLEQQTRNLQNQLDDANQLNSRLKEQNKSLEATNNARSQQDLGKRDEAINKMEASLHAKDEKIAALEEKLKAQQEDLKLIQTKRVDDSEKALKEAQAKAEAARAKAKALSASPNGASPSGGIKRLTPGQTKIVNKTPAVVAAVPKPVATTAADEPQATNDDDPFDKVPPAAAAIAAPAKPAASKTASTTEKAANDKLAEGKQLYAQKQYAKAQAAFEAYLATKPSANQAAEADFMIGECNYRNKQYDQAIINYQKVASKSTLPKAAAATLKQGMAFEQLADLEMAKTVYKKLIDQHPDSPEAKTAQERLGKL